MDYSFLDHKEKNDKFYKLQSYRPYEYQKKFHALKGKNGLLATGRALMAGNQIGKTLSGGAETAIHATNEYPEWWQGHRMPKNPNMVCSGVNSYRTRDLIQGELLGNPEHPGTGWIPKHLIHDTLRKPGIPNALEKIYVKRNNGTELTTITLLGYEDGARKFMGGRYDFGWGDEEPPMDIHEQIVRGTIATRGKFIYTFTPEEGMTQVVNRFLNDCPDSYALIQAGWEDAEHITQERIDELLAEMMPHEREMRSKGEPLAGSSMIFQFSDDDITCDPFQIPDWWPQILGVDFGGDHPFACIKWAFDTENRKEYLADCTKIRRATIPEESSIIKKMGGDRLPVAWPHDGNKQDKQSGKTIAQLYREEGVNMLPLCFSNPPELGKPEGTGGQGIYAGLKAMSNGMAEGRLKIFSHLGDWLKEKQSYHMKDGKVVDINDDAISASRYGYMSGIYPDGRARFSQPLMIQQRARHTQHTGLSNW